MPLKFYFDHNISHKIARGLQEKGITVITASEDGHHKTDDPLLLKHADQSGYIFFTSDNDFLKIASQYKKEGIEFNGIIYVEQEKMKREIGKIIQDLELIAKVYDPKDIKNKIEYIPFQK